MTPHIQHIIVKYLNQEASSEDLDALNDWLKTDTHKNMFRSYVRTHYAIDHGFKDFDTEREKKKILQYIHKHGHRTKVRRLWAQVSVAASILVLVTASLLFLNRDGSELSPDRPIIVDNTIAPGSDKAILTLADGTEVPLEKGMTYETAAVSSNGTEIRYADTGNSQTEMAYNYLTVPRGGQFTITLSDGTQVWLNSESQLRYPVAFGKEGDRVVELVYGEAYFDVSPSSEHRGAKFQVEHKAQKVEVLGTEFNIKAYRGEALVYTTLVEGKIALSHPTGREELVPEQQLRYDLRNNVVSLSRVNVFDAVSWKEGIFSFDYTPLEEIMTVLERWYDMEVVFENEALKQERFIGTINKKFSIEEVLTALRETQIIQTYEIHQNTIVLK